MGAVAKPTPTLTWRPIHGGLGGASRDGLREYHVQPSSIEGWWSVTASAAVATRKLVGSLPGTQQVAEAWESQLVGQGPLSSLRSGQHLAILTQTAQAALGQARSLLAVRYDLVQRSRR